MDEQMQAIIAAEPAIAELFAGDAPLTTAQKLDELAHLREQREGIGLELRQQIRDLETELDALTEDLDERVAQLDREIRREVLAAGATIRGSVLMAVWAKGRETWNGDLLKGYAIAHPDVLACRNVGEPSVSFRVIK